MNQTDIITRFAVVRPVTYTYEGETWTDGTGRTHVQGQTYSDYELEYDGRGDPLTFESEAEARPAAAARPGTAVKRVRGMAFAL